MSKEKKYIYRGFTQSQHEANKRYIEKHNLVETKFRTTKEEKETFQAHAEKMNESATAFIKRAIDETIKRDNK